MTVKSVATATGASQGIGRATVLDGECLSTTVDLTSCLGAVNGSRNSEPHRGQSESRRAVRSFPNKLPLERQRKRGGSSGASQVSWWLHGRFSRCLAGELFQRAGTSTNWSPF